ncbi:Helix-turn-helix [Oceanobacillus limi]|uniref:Helix-turn-helix n=1 Tax=Oceanobacillus limi TaxID=930131 RepID=A0A1I0FIE0_9BACI|nr:helix-turn-helix domain-containing protein [Oceanobacillus limi]SET57775.1 Helix-turn-helix [Oceanobacillus limi]
MTKGFGKKIKYYRIKAKMTQKELSKGIVSVSYLSKLEGGKIEPTKEIKELLCFKLKIDRNIVESDQLRNLCENWIKLVLERKKLEATKVFREISKDIDHVANTNLLNLFEINKLFYYLLTNNQLEIEKQFQLLRDLSTEFSGKERYYWLKAKGSYHYEKLTFKEALISYQEAERTIDLEQVYYPDEEKNDLYYAIALASSKLRNSYLSMVYAQKALAYYQSIYKLQRCARCHVLLGINYQRINEFDKSYRCYQQAASIAKNINDKVLLSVCNQNIGYLFSGKNNFSLAIEHFHKSYQLRESDLAIKRIVPVSSIMKEYYKKGDHRAAETWLEKGLDLTKSLDPSVSLHIYEFKVYAHLIRGFNQSFVHLITREVLPFLDKKQLIHEKPFYLETLADYYFHDRKYKLAATNYQAACRSRNQFQTE